MGIVSVIVSPNVCFSSAKDVFFWEDWLVCHRMNNPKVLNEFPPKCGGG